jgi:hypothetical protein
MTRPVLGSRWAYVLAFLVLAGFFAVTYSFRRITDTELNSYQARALVRHGDVALERYERVSRPGYFTRVNGEHRYSIYGVGVSVLAAPIYALLTPFDVSDSVLQGTAAIFFVTVSVMLMFVLLMRLVPPVIAAAGTLVFGFGTTMWPLASMALYQHGPVASFQILGMMGFFSSKKRGPALAGFGFAAAAFVRPPAAIPLLLVGLFYLVRERRSLGWYIAGAVVPLIAILVQNQWIWGSWLEGGYSRAGIGFHARFWSALFGLLFGWWRGMLVYSPVLILGFVGFVMACRKIRDTFESRLVVLGVSSIATILFYSKWTTWWNGLNQFGYRYLLDVVPFLIVLGAYAWARSERARTFGLPLAALSIMTMTWGAAPNGFGFDVVKFADRIADTSLGQAWIEFIHSPLPGVLRLAGVAAIGMMFFAIARARAERTSAA